MWKYENKVAKEIIEKTNSNKSLFDNIRKIKGEEKNYEDELRIYSEIGEEIKDQEKADKISAYWETIYKQHKNIVSESWNQETKEKYKRNLHSIREYGTEIINFCGPKGYNEHLDMAMVITEIHETGEGVAGIAERSIYDKNCMNNNNLDDRYRKMTLLNIDINEEKVENVLKKLKNKKAPGPDGLKNEMYKKLSDDRLTINTLTECYKNLVEGSPIPTEWKKSVTIMVPKTRKPTVNQLRPLSLTDVSYKIFMSLIKHEIEKHIEDNDMIKENQAGFTKGGRVEDNLLILQEIVEQTFISKETAIITAIDFKKAYDSIKRESFVEILKEYRVEEELIDIIVSIYSDDVTKIKLGDDKYVEIEIENGIRQGCTASTVLFKLITYKIIEEMEKKCKGVSYGNKKITCLFFADDGLLIARNISEAKEQIEYLIKIARKYGLEISRDKSRSLIYNMIDKPIEIAGIEVVRSIKYLGVLIQDTRDIFVKQREKIISQAQKLGNLAYSVTMKSCHKVMIGKAYWKSMALPSILYGAEVVQILERDLATLQRIENSVLRKILNAPSYACIAAMRGEVGIGTMKSRIARKKLQYLRYIKQGNKALLTDIWEKTKDRMGKWYKEMLKYMRWAEIEERELEYMTKEEVKKAIAKVVEKEWKNEVDRRTTLKIYKCFKSEMQQENMYSNNPSSTLWFKARANCLKLNDRKRFLKMEMKCEVCGDEKEDIIHFILECSPLNELRSNAAELQRPLNQNKEEIIGIFLFNPNCIETCKELLYRMWLRRNYIIRSKSK